MSTIYVLKEGRKTGPFTTEELEGNVEAGILSRDDLFWTEGMEDWQPLSTVIELVVPEESEPAEPLEVLHEGGGARVTAGAVHLTSGEEIPLAEITKVVVQHETIKRFKPVAGCIVLGVAIICLALVEIPRTTTNHWIIWGAVLLALSLWWLRLLLLALRIPAALVVIDLRSGDERIVRTKTAAAEDLCGAINLALAEVRDVLPQ